MTEEAKQTATEEKATDTQVEAAAEQEEATKSLDDKMDAILDDAEGKEKSSDSSSESKEKPAGEETKKEAEATEDPDLAKKEAEAAEETKIPKEFHEHEAWKRIKAAEEAAVAESVELKEKLEKFEKDGVLSEEDRATLENVKQFTSSRQFLEDKYKKEGFSDEKIAEKLAEEGFDVENPEGDLAIAAKAIGLDVENLSDQDRSDISNLVKISDALLQDRLGKALPAVLNPLSEKVGALTSKESGLKLHDDFVTKVKDDAVLDFDKDLAPDISKYLDDNPKANQQDVAKFLQDTYHEKLVLHKKAVERKGAREEKLKGNRPGGEGSKVTGDTPALTGDVDKDIDSFFDHKGIQ